MNKRIAYAFLFLILASINPTLGEDRYKQDNKDQFAENKQDNRDDTKYIQSLIDQAQYGDTVQIPAGEHYVHTIHLRSGVYIEAKGMLRQLPPDSAENFSFAKQYSRSPLFSGKNIQNAGLSFKATVLNEAIYLDNCKHIDLTDAKIEGDSTKLYAFAGIYLFGCEDIRITNIEISFFGKNRQSPSYYQRGTGIRVQSSRGVVISDNNIHHNGENGIFFHSCAAILVNHNRISHNGMSGIQVAFGSVGVEKDYKLTNNLFEANAADAIDINNPHSARQIHLQAIIEGNSSNGNGWVKGEKTRDGSGIATLVGLKGVVVRNNKSSNSNRPAVYIRQCDAIDLIENNADNFAEIVGNLGQIQLYKNTFNGLRVLANVKAAKLRLDSNNIRDVSLPNGIVVDSLVLVSNDLKGNININMQGQLICQNNTISSNSPHGAISLWKVNGATLSGNLISTSKSNALYINSGANNVVIEANKIYSPNTCIKDSGSHRLKISKNTLASNTYNASAQTLVSINPKDLHLSDNIYYLGEEKLEKEKVKQALGLQGNGTVYMKGDLRSLW